MRTLYLLLLFWMGLICLSGCAGGGSSNANAKGDPQCLRQAELRFKQCYAQANNGYLDCKRAYPDETYGDCLGQQTQERSLCYDHFHAEKQDCGYGLTINDRLNRIIP
jgi:hypothetical protein